MYITLAQVTDIYTYPVIYGNIVLWKGHWNSSTMCRFKPFTCTCTYIHVYCAEYICYDDGCHLRKYAENPCRSELTTTTKILSHLSIVVDKMHMAGHVDAWCRKTCDPHLHPELHKVLYSCSCACTVPDKCNFHLLYLISCYIIGRH